MTATLGVRRLPCGCGYARLPREAGRYIRRCHVCRTAHLLTVEPCSAELTRKLGGIQALKATWEPLQTQQQGEV